MVFLDANILLELVLPDRRSVEEVQSYLAKLSEPTAISVLTAHLVWYFGLLKHISHKTLEEVIAQHELVALLPEDYQWAVANVESNDFEDALQIASAMRHGCNTFVTLDQPLMGRYVETPIQFFCPA